VPATIAAVAVPGDAPVGDDARHLAVDQTGAGEPARSSARPAPAVVAAHEERHRERVCTSRGSTTVVVAVETQRLAAMPATCTTWPCDLPQRTAERRRAIRSALPDPR
jgi:hypothetical protein